MFFPLSLSFISQTPIITPCTPFILECARRFFSSENISDDERNCSLVRFNDDGVNLKSGLGRGFETRIRKGKSERERVKED